MNTLPEDIKIKIHRMKHEMMFQNTLKKIKEFKYWEIWTNSLKWVESELKCKILTEYSSGNHFQADIYVSDFCDIDEDDYGSDDSDYYGSDDGGIDEDDRDLFNRLSLMDIIN